MVRVFVEDVIFMVATLRHIAGECVAESRPRL